MALFDWLNRKPGTEKPNQAPPPQIQQSFGEDSPFITYVDNGILVVTDRDSFDYRYGESTLPNPAQRDLDDLLPTITRIRALSGGMFRGGAIESAVLLDTSDAEALALLRRCLTISEDASTFDHCACLGGPTLELFAGLERAATIGLQHGKAIRWSRWKHDARLKDGLILDSWLTVNGIAPRLLEILYQNPFGFTGGRMSGAKESPLSAREQRLLLVELRRTRGESDVAMADCDALISDEPRFGEAHTARGFLRTGKGEYAASVADFSTAYALGDLRADVLWGRAVALDNLGRRDEAIADCTAAIALDPHHANSYNSRGLIRTMIGQTGRAIDDFTKAIELAPEWEMPLIHRAQSARRRDDFEQAIADYTKAIQIIEARQRHDELPLLAKILWNRAEAHRSKGNAALGEADRAEAIRRDPRLASCRPAR